MHVTLPSILFKEPVKVSFNASSLAKVSLTVPSLFTWRERGPWAKPLAREDAFNDSREFLGNNMFYCTESDMVYSRSRLKLCYIMLTCRYTVWHASESFPWLPCPLDSLSYSLCQEHCINFNQTWQKKFMGRENKWEIWALSQFQTITASLGKWDLMRH